MYDKYHEDVEILLVYVREAHAIDGSWPMGRNPVEDPVTDLERAQVASTCVADLKLPMTALVDGVNDTVNKGYAAWPDRLYLVGKDGKIAYAGGRGPFGFKPDELVDAIEDELAKISGKARAKSTKGGKSGEGGEGGEQPTRRRRR